MTLPGPFVLLDDARATGAGPARLYERPVEIIEAALPHDVAPALERLRAAVRGGAHAAGMLGYEAGYALDPRLDGHGHGAATPLLWFGLFDRMRSMTPGEVADWLPDPAGACAGMPQPLIEQGTHAERVDRILAYIAAGDIYQANLTFSARVSIAGDPRALYGRLRGGGGGGWGGIVWTGAHWLLSTSPELFFTVAGKRLTARPMKGTLPLNEPPAMLAADPKQRAENLMIVDLIRNDLSRVAEEGSVAVPALFEVETYPTLHQMTSTVTARLAPGRDAIDVLHAAFPCGSVTGVPKLRAMEVIAEVEGHARGPYTGSIGWLDPAGDAAFNVAIRTLVVQAGAGRAGMEVAGQHAIIGLGSAIVADSIADAEWRECLDKGRFMSAAAPIFDLIETMRYDPADGIAELELHLARMKGSADALGFMFDRHDTRNELQAATFRLRTAMRLRLLLARGGSVAIEATPMPPAPVGPVAVTVTPLPVETTDLRLRHKTSDRAFYDEARRSVGSFEVVFADPDGFLTEGSFTSLFVERDGGLLTPPLTRGLQHGVLRASLIAAGRAVEADLRREDLAGGFMIGNALRGLMRAELHPIAG